MDDLKIRQKCEEMMYAAGAIGMEEVQPVVDAWLGHAMHADTYRLRESVLGGVVFRCGRSVTALLCAH